MELAQDYKAICGARIYHWAWMGNHFHMLVEVHANLRGFAGGLQQAYAQFHHARHVTSGVFWQSRFKSPPVELGPYLVSCGRYIKRNPVRAGLVTEAWAYAWSSAAHDVEKRDDGAALMSGVDKAVIRRFQKGTAIGGERVAGTLRQDRGRSRIKRGQPVSSVSITSQYS